MLFEQRFHAGIADGSVTCTFRRWKRSQAVAGHRYRVNGMMIEVDAVDVIDVGQITDDEARRSGYESASALIGDLRGTTEIVWDGAAVRAVDGAERLWRVRVEGGWRRRAALPLRWTIRDAG